MGINLTNMPTKNKITKQSLINILTGGFALLPLAKNIKRFFSYKEILIVLAAIIVSVSAGAGVFAYIKKEVKIIDNGKCIVASTMKSTVKEALEQNNITVTPDDYVSMSLDAELQRMKVNEINIKRAVPVNILADGKETRLMTYRETVGEALANSPFKLAGLDRLVGIKSDDKIAADMAIKIIRVRDQIVAEKESIPYEVKRRENNNLNAGIEKVIKNGQKGVREKQYKVVIEDGKEISRQLIKNTVITAPINMIMEIGTVLNYKTSRGDTLRYSKVLNMRATAYTASYKDTGKRPGDPGFGITRTGIRAKKGVIAVDPRVIPLGTRVYVEVAGKTVDYGYAVAADTGGAIKNDLIDLYFESSQTVENWGVRRVKVYILLDD